ncbi:hypothetical protein MTO96_033600 [Rhipicephalus appendiculatus]
MTSTITTTTTTTITPTTTTTSTTSTTITTTTSTTTTTTTTTTTPIPGYTTTTPTPVKLIICTVSETATSEYMYPPDEYCDYIFYTNVITSDGRIQAAKDPDSWDVFQKRGPKYRVTQLGISFDFRNVTANGLDDASNDLDALRTEGMKHYGLLTVLSFQKDFQDTVRSTKGVLEWPLPKFSGKIDQLGTAFLGNLGSGVVSLAT